MITSIKKVLSFKDMSKKQKNIIIIGIYTVIFIIIFSLAYKPLFYNTRSRIWNADSQIQQLPALVYIGDYLRELFNNIINGNFSIPLFDFNMGLGSEIAGPLNYHGFGDPLSLIAIFVPTTYTEVLYNILVILRLYLAGLAF